MNRFDARDARASGATTAARAMYERALDAFVSWRSGADLPLAQALTDAPGFVMAHVLKAWMLVGGRDPRPVGAAQARLAVAAALPASAHERLHLTALARVLADDHEGATTLLDTALQADPRDLLALAVACGIDHLTGDTPRLRDRIERVLPAWRRGLPGHHSVHAMHAFGLVECGEYERAEEAALTALTEDPGDARAHHAMAHVFEKTDRPDDGVRWLNAHAPRWAVQTVVATHGWWHLALFHLARDEPRAALALYDRRVRVGHSVEVADLIDATALLWRLHLNAVDTGARWAELAAAWSPRVDDGHCSFNDVHAMLAFVGAGDWAHARRLERVLTRRQTAPTRHGATTRQLGLPACRGLMAFGRGDHPLAVSWLAGLPARLHRLGGSHAQRDVLHLTLLSAVEAMRRPARVPRTTQHTKQDRPVREVRLPQPLPRFVPA